MNVGHPSHESYSQKEGHARLVARSFKFIRKMKARRILLEKTQRFLRGWWRAEEGMYINKEQRLVVGGGSVWWVVGGWVKFNIERRKKCPPPTRVFFNENALCTNPPPDSPVFCEVKCVLRST